MKKRVVLIILDSLGIGCAPDAELFGDLGSDTLASVARSEHLHLPNLTEMGLFNIDKVDCKKDVAHPNSAHARLVPKSMGKDTTIGHWELCGVRCEHPLPTYPDGFPDEIITEFERATGRATLCNAPYSGTDVIRDFGEEHMKTGALIVYTSADSVFQIAAHEEIVPLEELYRYCEIARGILAGRHGVGRVIARPFVGEDKTCFKRTTNRHDYSLEPPADTLLDRLKSKGVSVTAVGKIYDIFAGRGITKSIKTAGNTDGMEKTLQTIAQQKDGLIFVNLVDFDMLYGHRNDIDGYAKALVEFDRFLPQLLAELSDEDMLIITADHGCDPGTPSTDHSRECVPMLCYGAPPENLGTLEGFGAVAEIIEKELLD